MLKSILPKIRLILGENNGSKIDGQDKAIIRMKKKKEKCSKTRRNNRKA